MKKITLHLDSETIKRLKESGTLTSGQSAEILGMALLDAWNEAQKKKNGKRKK